MRRVTSAPHLARLRPFPGGQFPAAPPTAPGKRTTDLQMALVSMMSAFVIATATPAMLSHDDPSPHPSAASLNAVLSCGHIELEPDGDDGVGRGVGRDRLSEAERELALCVATPPEFEAPGGVLDVEDRAWVRRFERLLASIMRGRRRRRLSCPCPPRQ